MKRRWHVTNHSQLLAEWSHGSNHDVSVPVDDEVSVNFAFIIDEFVVSERTELALLHVEELVVGSVRNELNVSVSGA